jgi:protein phosphatase
VTEEEIINYKIHRAYRTKTKNYGDRTGADKYADKDYANNFISTHEITGIYVISTTKAVDCTLELNVSSELTGGRAKIVVIRDNEIVEYLDFGDGKQLVYDVKGEHLYVVKLVCEKAKSSKELEGMGTTLVCALYDGESYYCIWVGDSRIYALDDSGLCQISHDHSFVQNLIDSGRITKEEAKQHPNRNIITKAVGIEDGIIGDVCRLSAENVRGILLCSDRLCGYVREEAIAATLNEKESITECCAELVKLANESGGLDNITVAIHRKQ